MHQESLLPVAMQSNDKVLAAELQVALCCTFSGGRVSVIVSCSPEAPCTGYMNLYASVGSYSDLKPCST
jgi:hypothetical protein